MERTDLPPALALLWGVRERPRRGPRPALSLDAVVRAAIEIADAEGLAGLSMSRLAERLGYTTMSLYRYVPSKDDLLTLMLNGADEEPPTPDPGDWRGSLEAWTRAMLGVYRRHPWMLQVPITAPPAGPRQLAWLEASLRGLSATGLAPIERLAVTQLLHGYALGEARLSADLGRGTGDGAAGDRSGGGPSYGALLRLLINPTEYPELTALVESGALDGSTEYTDEDFDFGLQRVLDGVERLIASRPTPPAATPPA